MLLTPIFDDPPTSYLTAHAWRYMQLTPQQRLDWYTLYNEKMTVVEAMPHDTLDERRKRVLSAFLAWEEMERWTMETITANLQADLVARSPDNQADQEPDQEADHG